MKKVSNGGGWQAIGYTFRKAREVGALPLWRAMRSRNACKTCAYGMGGQRGGMVNEEGRFPEVCKKSLQAMAADMRGKIEPRFFERYTVAELAGLSPRELEACGRLAEPLFVGPDEEHFRAVSWAEATSLVGDALRQTDPDRMFFYASGRSSNEAGFVLQLLARALGTNHVSNCSYYCHQASGVGLKETIGTGTATVELEDLARADLVFLIGGNPASNHPRLMSALARLRRRGGQVIVVNPLREVGLVDFRVPSNLRSMLLGSPIASLYLQPRIGGDIGLLVGIAKRLVEEGMLDRNFIQGHTDGFDEVAAMIERTTWEEIEVACGLPRSEIESAADLYAASQKVIFAWTMGITHHAHGVDNVRWIVNLALMRGMVGKPGAGLMPIRGHSNVQGLGSVGVSPQIARAAVDGLASLGIAVPQGKGRDTLEALEGAGRGEADFALCLGGNLYGASPDASFAGNALGKIGLVVYLSTTLNTGHTRGRGRTTLVLPVRARDEEDQTTTQESMFNFIRVSDGGRARFEGPRSEVDVLTAIGHAALGAEPVDWLSLVSHAAIRRLIARLVPAYGDLEEVDRSKKEFHISGRILHTAQFPREGGRASFSGRPLPDRVAGQDRLMLMTIRSEGQFNTVVYEEEDLYRGQERRDVILMNSSDIERFGFRANDPVRIESESGMMEPILVREAPIAQGCAAMYYPEANALVPRLADPESRTPAFKSVPIRVLPSKVAPSSPAEGERSRSKRDLGAC